MTSRTRSRLRLALSNQRGAVDLPSIMVGAIVLGLLTAAILATVFTVIPWAQDNAAKQKASQVVQAQSLFYAMASSGTINTDGSNRTAPGSDPSYARAVPHLVNAQTLADSVDTEKVFISGFQEARHDAAGQDAFMVNVRSDTGTVFTATSQDPQPAANPDPAMVTGFDDRAVGTNLSGWTVTDAESYAGTSSVTIGTTSTLQAPSLSGFSLPVQPGDKVRLSAWVRTTADYLPRNSADTGSTNSKLRIGTQDAELRGSLPWPNTGGDWEYLELTVTAAGRDTVLHGAPWGDVVRGRIWVDNMVLERI